VFTNEPVGIEPAAGFEFEDFGQHTQYSCISGLVFLGGSNSWPTILKARRI